MLLVLCIGKYCCCCELVSVAVRWVQWVERCRWRCVLVSVAVAVRWCNGLISVVGAVYW